MSLASGGGRGRGGGSGEWAVLSVEAGRSARWLLQLSRTSLRQKEPLEEMSFVSLKVFAEQVENLAGRLKTMLRHWLGRCTPG